MGVEELVEKIKAKVMGSLAKKKKKKPYMKMDKTASIRIEIRSRKARQIIEKTLATVAADDRSSSSGSKIF